MFKVITTGKNKNYGSDGQERLLADNMLLYCLKHDIIYSKVEYFYKHSDKVNGVDILNIPVTLEPIINKVDVAREMKFQSNLLESIKKDLNTFDERDLKIKNLLDKR